jgi:hypothetical protein
VAAQLWHILSCSCHDTACLSCPVLFAMLQVSREGFSGSQPTPDLTVCSLHWIFAVTALGGRPSISSQQQLQPWCRWELPPYRSSHHRKQPQTTANIHSPLWADSAGQIQAAAQHDVEQLVFFHFNYSQCMAHLPAVPHGWSPLPTSYVCQVRLACCVLRGLPCV